MTRRFCGSRRDYIKNTFHQFGFLLYFADYTIRELPTKGGLGRTTGVGLAEKAG